MVRTAKLVRAPNVLFEMLTLCSLVVDQRAPPVMDGTPKVGSVDNRAVLQRRIERNRVISWLGCHLLGSTNSIAGKRENTAPLGAARGLLPVRCHELALLKAM